MEVRGHVTVTGDFSNRVFNSVVDRVNALEAGLAQERGARLALEEENAQLRLRVTQLELAVPYLTEYSTTATAATTTPSAYSAKATFNGDVSLNRTNANQWVGVTNITGHLVIDGQGGWLTDMSMFQSLTSVGGHLYVYDNSGLNNVNGFRFLTSVGGYLAVIRNNALINVNEFLSLTRVGNYLSIYSNDALTNMGWLPVSHECGWRSFC